MVGLAEYSFLIVISVSVFSVKVLGVLSFDDTWWDITVNVFFLSIAALVLGIIAVLKNKDRSVLVLASVIVGLLAVLFILLHSLFIGD